MGLVPCSKPLAARWSEPILGLIPLRALKKGAPARRFLLVAAANILAAGAGLALFSLMAKSQGPSALGQMSLALSFLVYGLILSNYGTDSAAIRAVSQNPEIAPRMIANVVAFRLTTNVPILIGGALLAFYYRGSHVPALMAILTCSLIAGAVSPAWLATGTERSDVLGYYTVASPVATLLFALLFTFIGWPSGILAFAAARVAGDLVATVGLLWWVLATFRLPGRPQVADVLELGRVANPIGASRVISGFGQAADLFILSLIVSRVDTGIYAASLRVYLLLVSMSLLYSGVVFPAFSRAAKDGGGAVKAHLYDNLKRTLPFAAAALLAVAGSAPLLLGIVFGPQFQQSEILLRVLCVATLFNFASVTIGTALMAIGRFHQFMQNTMLSTIILIFAKILLTVEFGPIGAAAATCLAEAAMMVLQLRSLTAKQQQI